MKDTQRKEQLLAAERAAEWLQRLEKGGPDVQAEFARWLRKSPQHVRDILLANALQHALRHMRFHHRVDVQALKNRCRGSVIKIGSPEYGAPPGHRAGSSFWQGIRGKFIARSRVAWTAIGVALVAIVSLTIATQTVSDHDILTRAGEWRNTRLEDGTFLRVGPRTSVSVEMRGDRRLLHLARGRIMVYVARDPARPLYVETDLATARAVGTAFAVSLSDALSVFVTVQEGTVAIARGRARDPSDPPVAPLKAVLIEPGEGVAVSTDGQPLVARPVDLNRELAWVDEKLIAGEHSTVADVVREFNLNNRTQIRLIDRALGERPIRGELKLSDPVSFVGTLKHLFPVSIVEDRGTLFVVPRRRTIEGTPKEPAPRPPQDRRTR